jgi:hypothetical protein
MMSSSSMRRRAALALSALALNALSPLPAFAQSSDSATARALFAEGRKLMNDKRFEDACPKFEESLRLDPGMGTQFNLAFCWEQIGRSASAWAMFLDVAAAARAAGQAQREAAARERAAALEPKLSRLSIRVASPAEGMEITRDEISVGRAVWGTAVPVDPGTHKLKASAPGKLPWTQDVRVADAAARVSVDVPRLEDAPVEAAAAPAAAPVIRESVSMPEPDHSRGGADGQRIAAWVLGGVGVAGLGVGTYFALRFQSEKDKADSICPDASITCPEPEQAEYDRHHENAVSARTGIYVGVGVGGVALVTSLILFVTSSQSDSASSLQVAPLLGSDAWGGALSGRF